MAVAATAIADNPFLKVATQLARFILVMLKYYFSPMLWFPS
jgi:hypothetical protein